MKSAYAKVTTLRDYPRADDPDQVKRPYRLWDSKEKKNLQWRCFKNLRHAHMGALTEAAWTKGDNTIEVYDIRVGGLRGQYKRHGDQIKFWRSNHHLEES